MMFRVRFLGCMNTLDGVSCATSTPSSLYFKLGCGPTAGTKSGMLCTESWSQRRAKLFVLN